MSGSPSPDVESPVREAPPGTLRALWRAGPASRAALLGVLVFALLLRIGLVGWAQPALFSDARDYYVLARNVADGRGYFQVYGGETAAFDGFTFYAFRSPGYPLLLAGWHSLVGWEPALGFIPNILADLLTLIGLLRIGAALFGAVGALVAGGVFSLHVLWTASLTSESFYAALFTWLALALVTDRPRRSDAGALVTGLLLLAALFTRPITLCFFPLVLGRLLWPPRPRGVLMRVALLLLPTAIGLGAWGWRNERVLGEPVLLTTNFGHHNAWDYGLHADRAFAELRAAGLNEAQINDELTRVELGIALREPGPWLRLWLCRMRDLFSLAAPPELDQILWRLTYDTSPSGPWPGRVFRALYAQYYVTYPLAAAGVVLLILRRRSLGGLLLLVVAYVALHAVVSRGDVRLLAPLYPLLCVLIGGGVTAPWRRPPLSVRPTATGAAS